MSNKLFGARDNKTEQAMNEPRPGDVFSEMYAFYVYVLERHGDLVVFMEANPPCTLPVDGKIGTLPLDEFKSRYAYETIPGYSVRLFSRDKDVSGWAMRAAGYLDMKENVCPS